jgi:hypothetical protein
VESGKTIVTVFPQDTHPAVRADATGAESALGVY